jgi:multidrug resistance efflux pump
MDDIDFISDEIATIKSGHNRKGATPRAKKIRVRGSVEVARDNYRAAKRIHKAQIRQARANIKSHKLMIKQAKTAYKLVKLAERK